MRRNTKRYADAVWFVLGCGVSLASGGCSGHRIVVEDDSARGGEAGDPGSGGTGATATPTGGVAGASSNGGGGSGTAGHGGARTSGEAGEPGSGGKADSGRSGGSGGSGGRRLFTGVCEQRGYATVTASAYAGYEEFFIVSEEAVLNGRADDPADEDLVCRIRFNVSRVGPAPAGCMDLDLVTCEWTHAVEYSDPGLLIDVNGACARSEVGWGQAFINEVVGSRVSYGYISMYQGHDSVVMTYSEAMTEWIAFGRAFWDDVTGEFEFRNRHGACRY